jgi:HAD superfamily hydrolase (TIGR01490 family)
MSRLALFDLDRTLVRKNTAQLYVRYQRRIGEVGWRQTARVAWWMAQYTLGVVDAERVAVRAIGTVAGMSELVLAHRSDDWFRTDVAEHICDAGRRAVDRHNALGDVTAIVTGASRYSGEPVARALHIKHVVATELEVDAKGRFTGRHVAPLNYGEGKIARAERLAQTVGLPLEEAIFYSDSISDMPLFLRVKDRVVVNPDPRMLREAKKRGWRIEKW